jgi:hypothetical protein
MTRQEPKSIVVLISDHSAERGRDLQDPLTHILRQRGLLQGKA